MFSRTLRATLTPPSLRPIFSSSHPIFLSSSILNCNKNQSFRAFHQSSAAMTIKAYFVVEYKPKGAPTSEYLSPLPLNFSRKKSLPRHGLFPRLLFLTFPSSINHIYPILPSPNHRNFINWIVK
jgi:hypothetical protein